MEGDNRWHLPIFDGIGDSVLATLVESSSVHQYRAGSIIVEQGKPIEGLQVIHRGIVDLSHINGHHECGVLLLSAKDLIMPSATLFGEGALLSARALTTARVLVIETAAVNTALAQSPILANNLMKAVSGQWRMAVRSILDLNCRSAAQRVGAFLLRIADLQPEEKAAELPISKRHLAVRLGMTAETLSRMLQVLAKHGLHLRGRTIIIRDRSAVEQFCGPNPYARADERSLDVFAL